MEILCGWYFKNQKCIFYVVLKVVQKKPKKGKKKCHGKTLYSIKITKSHG